VVDMLWRLERRRPVVERTQSEYATLFFIYCKFWIGAVHGGPSLSTYPPFALKVRVGYDDS
jgi:hypothetical protein